MKKILCQCLIITIVFCSAYSFASETTVITWKMMADLDFETGNAPPSLRELHDKPAEITGYIVPLELDEYIDNVKEFLLVPNPLACIHIPPPPPNQIVFVKMEKAIPLDMDYRGVTIKGTFTIFQIDDNRFSFKLAGISAKEGDIEYEDPLMQFLEDSNQSEEP